MYESKFPEVDDVVMVQVRDIAEMGAYVSLLEYNGIEGMILLSELSRRRIRSITKLIKVRPRGRRMGLHSRGGPSGVRLARPVAAPQHHGRAHPCRWGGKSQSWCCA